MIHSMQDVNISNHSSRKENVKTLAPKKLLEALQEFANSGTDSERVTYFRNRWPGFLDDLVYTGYKISIGAPGANPADLERSAQREVWPMWRLFEQFRNLVRAAWIGDEAILGILLRVGIEEERTENRIVPDWRRSGFRYVPRTNFQAAVYELLKHSRQARVCANPDCANPYFLTLDPRRKFCSTECTRPAQKEWRKRWWERHGKQWRKKRAKQSTKRRKP
jgi:hypothetical protein